MSFFDEARSSYVFNNLIFEVANAVFLIKLPLINGAKFYIKNNLSSNNTYSLYSYDSDNESVFSNTSQITYSVFR